MQPASVSIVLMNYLRPQNMSAVIRAWKEQSVPAQRVIVIDNSPAVNLNHEVYPSPVFAEANDVWRFTTNHGCPGRLIAALSQFDCRYVVFADDDLIPGRGAIELMLDTANSVCDRFSTIGQVNRLLKFEVCNSLYSNASYDPRSSIKRQFCAAHCDITCRVHMVLTDMLHHVFTFRSQLLELGRRLKTPFGMQEMVNVHDDILLCLGIQKGTGYPSFVVPASHDAECTLLKTDMDDAKGQWRRPGHFSQRTELVQAATSLGWRRPSAYMSAVKGGAS